MAPRFTGHTWLVILFSAIAAAAASAAVQYPQYAGILAPLAAALLAASGKTTSVALHAEPPQSKEGVGPTLTTIIMSALCVSFILLALCVSLVGCGGNFEEARDAHIHMTLGAPVVRDNVHCNSLDSDHTLFVRAGWVEGSIAGATGVVAGALPSGVPDGWRIGLGTSAAVFAALTVKSIAQGNNAAQDWARDCSQ